MRGIKYKIIYIVGLLVLSLSLSITFAAFVFNQVVRVEGEIGKITILSKDFYDYSYDKSNSDKKIAKLRKDTVAILDNITLSSNDTFVVTTDLIYIDGKSYYSSNSIEALLSPYVDEEHPGDYEVGDQIVGTVYELQKQYTGISGVGLCQYYNGSAFVDIEKTVNNLTITFTVNSVTITITCTVDQSEGRISTASISTITNLSIIECNWILMV